MSNNKLISLESALKKAAESVDTLSSDIEKISRNFTDFASSHGDHIANTASLSGPDPIMLSFTIFVLACFVGYYVVWKVTPALHTPLMSVTNAISGIIVVGAMLAVGGISFSAAKIFGFFAVFIASINVFGGFFVTHRMLEMFRKK